MIRQKLLSQLLVYATVALIIYIVSAWTYRSIFFRGSMLAPFLAMGLLSVFILWKPIIGMAAYLLIYPLVPASENLNMAKIGTLLLTIYLLGIWMWLKAKDDKLWPTIKLYKWMYLFFGFLCFSPLLGVLNGFSIIDWARDIAPLLPFLLIPLLIDHLVDGQNNWLLILFFGPLAIAIPQYMGWIQFLPVNIAMMHPSWLFGLGISLYLSNYQKRYFWLYFGIMGLVITLFTTGRTIWITSILMAGLLMYSHTKYKRQALVSFYILCGVSIFILSGGIDLLPFSHEQHRRLNSLIEYKTDLSYENRVDELEQSIDLFKKSPIVGVGYGYKYTFWRHFIRDIGQGYLTTNFTHNDIANALAKGGLIGFFLLLMMLYDFYRKLKMQMRTSINTGRTAWAVGTIIILMSSLLTSMSSPILQARNGVFGLFFLISLGLGYEFKKDGNNAS